MYNKKIFVKFTIGFLFLTNLILSNPTIAMETIDPDEIKPGMTGYGLTVFKGTKPEKFKVVVVDVVPNFMLKQDIILIKCDHPITDKAGVIGGMSGSPIFINGKLAGALAYGWRFSNEPLAGVTPIKNMLELQNRKQLKKRQSKSSVVSLSNNRDFFKKEKPDTFFTKQSGDLSSSFIPATTPLSISGFGGFAAEMLTDSLLPFGIEPMAGGGGNLENQEGPDGFEPGSAIGVQMIRGDISATGIGTVTTVQGNNVLAFGHPMFNMGEGYLPVTTAKIHTVVSSIARSNKMGSPIKVAGSLVQDRNAAIMAKTDLEASMIPVHFNVENITAKTKDTYNVEVADIHMLTARFVHAALIQFIQHSTSDVTDLTASIKGKIKIKGKPVYTLGDSGVSRRGLKSLVSYFRPVAIINAVLNNPFEDITIEWIKFDVKLDFNLNHSKILGAYLTSSNPKPGDTINLNVRLLDYGSNTRIVTIPVTIPKNSHGKKIKISVGGGDNMMPPLAMPETLDQLLGEVQKFYPPKSLAVHLETGESGMTVRGKTMLNLPSFAARTLQPRSSDDNDEKIRTVIEKVVLTDNVISGKKIITVQIGKR